MVRKLVGLLLISLLALIVAVPALAAVPYPPDPPVDPPTIEGPTSLETWVVITDEALGWVRGTLSLQNVGEYPGVISDVFVVVEARQGREWVEVGTCDLLADGTYLELPVADIDTLTFECSFATNPLMDKSYRAISCVVLDNHPTGSREFIYRESF